MLNGRAFILSQCQSVAAGRALVCSRLSQRTCRLLSPKQGTGVFNACSHVVSMKLWPAAVLSGVASLRLRLACLPLQQMSPRATEQAFPDPLQAASQDPALRPYRPPSPHSSYRRSASLRNAALRGRPETARTSDSPWQVAAPVYRRCRSLPSTTLQRPAWCISQAAHCLVVHAAT